MLALDRWFDRRPTIVYAPLAVEMFRLVTVYTVASLCPSPRLPALFTFVHTTKFTIKRSKFFLSLARLRYFQNSNFFEKTSQFSVPQNISLFLQNYALIIQVTILFHFLRIQKKNCVKMIQSLPLTHQNAQSQKSTQSKRREKEESSFRVWQAHEK